MSSKLFHLSLLTIGVLLASASHANTIGYKFTDLGTIGASYRESWAIGINNSSQVAGDSITSDGTFRATIWNGTTPTDLNNFLDASDVSAGWYLVGARDINDNGWIVGIASNTITGVTHAFLLTPVPEPETYAMFMAGLGLMGLIARRRKNGQA
jgi:probable HAF family extracellular repeat protein